MEFSREDAGSARPPAPSPYGTSAAPSPYGTAPKPSPYAAPVPSAPSPYGPPAAGDPGPRRRTRAARQTDSQTDNQTRNQTDNQTRNQTRSHAKRRRRSGRPRLTPGQAVAGTLMAGSALTAAGYLSHRGDGGTDLDATLGGRAAVAGQALDGTQPDGGAATPPSAASLRFPAGLPPELLLNRVTYGATDALRIQLAAHGPAAWLAAQFDPDRLADPGGDAVSALFPHLALSSAGAQRSVPDGIGLQRELAAAHLGRAVWSSRQLLELMVDFWSNHFNITCPGDKAPYTRHRFDADIIRKGALGSFETLLQASAVHPAMLAHLDAGTSSGGNPNENYARELLETHTVGTVAGFTEHDVRQAALLLTGFEVRAGVSRYVPARHYVGRISVLGFTHSNSSAEGGRTAVQQFLSYLARLPATATTLARKLAVRFVADSPPGPLVTRLAQTYLNHGTALTPVLSELLTSPEFAESAQAKQRRPMERLAATVRTLGLSPGHDQQGLLDLAGMLGAAGHAPLGSPFPGGYPDVASAWQSTAVALSGFNATAQLVHGWWPKTLVNPGPEKLPGTQPGTRTAAIEAVGRRVLGREPAAAERAAVARLLSETQLPDTLARGSWEQKETISLIAVLLLCSPAAVSR